MTTAKLSFAQRAASGSRLFRIAQRVIVIVTLLFLTIGGWSAYRAWFQVRRLELQVISSSVRPGIPVFVQVITSGRTLVEVRLELVQGTHAELLANLRVAASHDGFFDPRNRQGTMNPSFTAEFLAHFQAGPAVIRATATGRPQWMRTPPPVVKEIPVVIEP